MKIKFRTFNKKEFIISLFCFVLCYAYLGLAQTANERDEFGYGKKLYEDKFYDLSGLQFSEFLRKYPESPLSVDALYLLAESYFYEGEFSEAQKGYLNLLITHPQSDYCAHAQFKIAVSHEKQSRMESAIESYFRTYIFYPKNPWAYKALLRSSQLAFQLKDYAKAESLLFLLIDQVDNATMRAQARFGLVQVYQGLKEYEKALNHLDRIQSETTSDAILSSVHLYRGQIYKAIGHIAKSEDSFRQGLISAPSDSMKQQLAFQLGLLQLKNFNLSGSKQNLTLAAEFDSDPKITVMALCRLGSIQLMQEENPSAIQTLNQCLELQPDDSTEQWIRYQLATGYRLNGQYDTAEKQLQNLISESVIYLGKNEDPFLSLAVLYVETQQYEQALKQYIVWINRSPDSKLIPYVLFQTGSIYIDQLRLIGEGLPFLQEIWQKYPSHTLVPSAKMKYAEALEFVKRYNEARQIYQSIQESYPGRENL